MDERAPRFSQEDFSRSYLVILAGLVGVTLYYDFSFALSAGIILTGMTIWAILVNHKVPIPRW